MRRNRTHRTPLRRSEPARSGRALPLAVVAALAVVVLLLTVGPVQGDDRDLLRTATAEPYVFFMVDTSASMNADVDSNPLPANGDDPRSKIFMAKRALYEVFLDATEFNYGFATYNQDAVAVTAKHWLYVPSVAPGWSVPYPTLDDQWVFGPHFDNGTGNPIRRVGSCSAPLDLANPAERARLNRLSRGDQPGDGVTLWFEDSKKLYRMAVQLSTTDEAGNLVLTPQLSLAEVTGSCNNPTFTPVGQILLDFREIQEFLYMENAGDGSGNVSGGLSTIERFGGYWDQVDAQAEFDCGDSGPFTGRGWDGNYDEDDYVDQSTSTFLNPNANVLKQVDTTDVDSYESGPTDYNLRFHPTYVFPEGRNVDRGDVLPFYWGDNHHFDFLQRLNPLHGSGLAPDFGIASYFEDRVPTGENRSILKLKKEAERPLIAAGGSPFAKAINDFRCWYAEKGTGKCKNGAYPQSWERVARDNIGNESGCVQPYLILVTDAENTCGGESPVADVAGLKSQANVRTWIIAIAPEGSGSGQINAIPKVGKGELIYVQDESQLRQELQRIRGLIEEEARTFASAAVPTVQASVTDQIYVSNFTPLNDKSIWPGTVLSFVKPLPLDDQARPDTTSDRLNWSAGDVLLTQSGGLGSGDNQRRVYYAPRIQDPPGGPAFAADGITPVFDPVPRGRVPLERTLLKQTLDPGDGVAASDLERDRWLGMGFPFTLGDEVSEDTTRTAANQVLDFTYAVKEADVEGIGLVKYLMGDVFHSDPVIIGSPPNLRYLAANLNNYRDFFLKFRDRRKVLLVGTNDGMLHGFDAGRPQVETRTTPAGVVNDLQFDNGTGKELFAYVPRPMLNELRQRSASLAHDWGVDGSLRVADVYVDVAYASAPEEADREWRTVLIGGFRRGGRGYYALDITQPDALKEVSVGLPSRITYIPAQDKVVPTCHDDPQNPTLDSTNPDILKLDCHTEVPYPSPLWEMDDTVWDATAREYVSLDEDGIGGADLSNSWSHVNIGRVRICTGTDCLPSTDPEVEDDLEDRYVAIFGGGLPAAKSNWGLQGNWIYMVDVETGQVIYKRLVEGSVAAEVSAVDTNADAYLDRIYFGTTAGYVYRIDLEDYEVDSSTGERTLRPFPALEPTMVQDVNGGFHSVDRIPYVDATGDPVWQPRQIFDTVAPISSTDSTLARRPLFMPISVLFVGELGKYAISFGTGDREDLWRFAAPTGRFYTFVDDSDQIPESSLPITESGLRQISLTDTNIDVNDPNVSETNFLLDRTTPGSRGWVMVLEGQERLISDPFNLSGITFFVTFTPRVQTSGGQCTREGDSRIFAVNTTNANGLLRDEFKNRVRYIQHKAFATQPFTEQGQTKNPSAETGSTADDLELGTHLNDIMEELKGLLPANCEFPGQRVDVKLLLDRTNVTFVAPVPVCVIEANWTELSP